MSGAKSLLKAGSKAIKDISSLKDDLKYTFKPTVWSLLGATFKELANRLAADTPTAALPQEPLNTYTVFLVGTASRRRMSLYKSGKIMLKRFSKNKNLLQIIYNFIKIADAAVTIATA